MRHSAPFTCLLALGLFASSATAQWGKDASANLKLSDGAGEETQPKLRVGAGGQTWASWYDSDPGGSPAFGFDVRVQRLDPAGAELLAPGGVLVADRGFSSTQDYGLDVDPSGRAWLAFRDDRSGSVQVTATRLGLDGTQAFGDGGLQLTSSSAFFGSPKVAALEDGGAVVAWTENASVRVQRLGPDGVAQFGAGLLLPTAPGTTNLIADLRTSDNGSVILSFVSQAGGFFGPRELFAQKLSAAGAPLWGAQPVAVFDTGSLQIGSFPEFKTDGAGGAVFAWYSPVPLQAYVQRVDASGALLFQVGGLPVSNDASRVRADPAVAFDSATGETLVAWVELTANQTQDGVFAQRFDAAGQALWTTNGVAVVPVGALDVTNIDVVANGAESTVVWIAGAGFGQALVRAQRLDATGAAVHAIADLGSVPSQRGRLDAERGPFGEALGVWVSDELGDNDVFGQSLAATGALGPVAGAMERTAGANLDSLTGTVGPLGGTLDLQLDVSGSGHAFGLVLGTRGMSELPFTGGQFILIDLALPELLKQGVQPGPVAGFSIPIPVLPALCGLVVSTQGVHVDVLLPLELSNAVDVFLGL